MLLLAQKQVIYVFEMSIERASGSGIGTLALRPGHFLIVGLVDQVS